MVTLPLANWSATMLKRRTERSRSERIEWRVDSKIAYIYRAEDSEKDELGFDYDACYAVLNQSIAEV